MAGLMIADTRGGRACTLEDVRAVPVPLATKTYQPVPNGDLVEIIKGVARETYGVGDDALELSLALSGKDQQMFGSLTINADAVSNARFDSSLTICFRNAYNKSLSAALAAGAHSWICSNLLISGDIIELRKHTPNILRDLRALIERVVQGASGEFQKSMAFADRLSGAHTSRDDCYSLVGLAMGHKVLRTQQASVVLQELENPSHEEFRPLNAWSLYNHFTEGTKRTTAAEAMTRHQGVTRFFEDQFVV